MEFTLNEEQELLKESVLRLVEKDYTFENRNALLATPERFSRDLWKKFAELGWLAVSIPETHGGFGGGAVENMILCEAFGRAMALEPFISTVVLAGKTLALADHADFTPALLPKIASGELLMCVAFAERNGRYDHHHVTTTATASGNSFSLNGEKVTVMDAPNADKLVISARTSGSDRDQAGIALFLIDKDANGLDLEAFNTMDGPRAAHLKLKDVPGELLVPEDRGYAVLEEAIQWGIAARCAQATGSMDAGFQQTLDYVKTREQFGVPIGSFQVLQHRLVDVFMDVRECQSMMFMLAQEVMGEGPAERRRAVAAAKAFVGERARRVGQEMVQMHGGIGMTEEYTIGHYFRSLTQFRSMFGSTDYHLNKYAELAYSSAT